MDGMMAQVFRSPENMELRKTAVPQVSQDGVLIRVKACGVCGSDVEWYYGKSPLETPTGTGPLVLGHEFTGEIVKLGDIPKSLGSLALGDRVVVNPVQYCHACDNCRQGMPGMCANSRVIGVSVDGAFAEYCSVSHTAVYKLPASVSFEEGALSEPLACAVYAVQRMDVQPGSVCIVIGAGVIGFMMLQLIKSRGAGLTAFVGTRDYRLELGRKYGADVLINVREKSSLYYTTDVKATLAEHTGGKTADRAIVATGSLSAIEQALHVTGRGAVIVHFGLVGPRDTLKVPVLETMNQDKTLHFSWVSRFTFPAAVRAIDCGIVKVRDLVTHKLPLARLKEGIEMVKDKSDDVMKVVVTP